MKERIRFAKPNDEGHGTQETIEREDPSFAELLELTQSEPDAIQSAIANLQKEFENAPKTGATISFDGLYNRARREFVVPLYSAEQKERLLDNFTNLGIYPWEDSAMLIVDRRKDLEKLRLAGFIATEIEPQPPFVPTYDPPPEKSTAPEKADQKPERALGVDKEIQDVLEKLSKRVRPDAHAFPYPDTRGKPEPVRIARGQDTHAQHELRDGDPEDMDDEIRSIVDSFDAGDPDVADSQRFRAFFW